MSKVNLDEPINPTKPYWTLRDYMRDDTLDEATLQAARDALAPAGVLYDETERLVVEAMEKGDIALVLIRSWLHGATAEFVTLLETSIDADSSAQEAVR